MGEVVRKEATCALRNLVSGGTMKQQELLVDSDGIDALLSRLGTTNAIDARETLKSIATLCDASEFVSRSEKLVVVSEHWPLLQRWLQGEFRNDLHIDAHQFCVLERFSNAGPAPGSQPTFSHAGACSLGDPQSRPKHVL